MPQTVHRSCTLCEATCGLTFEIEGDRILSIRPDEDDVFSKGFICPKGVAISEIHHDPDRLRTPMRRSADGTFEPISWEDAFELAATKLAAIRKQHGNDAVAVYIGNPVVHNHGAVLVRGGLLKTLGTRNAYSAGSQDTSTRLVASYHLYGASWAVPIPDVDRTDYLLCIGANPYVSNGSFLTAPNVRERIRGIRRRGGKVIVVDPRRTETARESDEHVAILPGGDAAFLLAMTRVLVEDGRVDRERVRKVATGWDELEALLEHFTPERVAPITGVEPAAVRRLAREFVAAKAPVAYSRIGVCNNRFGTLAGFATDVLNLAADRLGKVGGAMFPTAPIDLVAISRMIGADGYGRFRSRVRGLPETIGDLPAACLAEEIETPGEGQVRALVTYAGNPVLSVPNGRRLQKAIESLEFMVSVDLYVNETTRHADLILPPAWALTEDHWDALTPSFAIRNFARVSPALFERKDGELADWQILAELAYRLGGGPTGMKPVDALLRLSRRLGIYEWDPDTTAAMMVRIGPHGDRFLPWSKGLNRKKLEAAPHGIDLGELEPGFERRVMHEDKKLHLAEPVIASAIRELADEVVRRKEDDSLLLIGRRELRTNNSWMHNAPSMVAGRERCVLYVHPEDASRAGVHDGEVAVLESRVHRGPIKVRVTDDMRPGVVSLPHGWGHAPSAPWQKVAGSHPGVSANDWTDDAVVESVVGQSILN
ncbi:MAG: molybdopterin-dependent oxidoreductase, partial [Candidatus Binatia bacterium]